MPTGRPTKFDPKMLVRVTKLCDLGATDAEIAEFLEIDISTFYRWKAENTAFCEAIKTSKVAADERVERSLYQRATGYRQNAVKIMTVSDGSGEGSHIEHVDYVEIVPPDTTAAIFWLKNRRPAEWRDKSIVEHQGEGFEAMTDEQLAEVIRRGSSGAGRKDLPTPSSGARKPH
jgi:hypothetical protein